MCVKNQHFDQTVLLSCTQVTVVCEDGYQLQSGNGELECDASSNPGSWIGFTPECTRIECPYIDVPNASPSPTGRYYFGDTVTYSCGTGYNMTGE